MADSDQFKEKVAKVMHEYKKKKLKTSAGSKVKGRTQAIAIALSEARRNPNK
jgi:hypothetical protein